MADQIRSEAKHPFSIEKLTGIDDRRRLEAYLTLSDGWTVPRLSQRIDLGLFAEKILYNGVAVLAVDTRKTDVGMAAFYCNDRNHRRAYLTHLAVSPQHRGLGIGKALLNYSKDYSKSRDMDLMELEVYSTNESGKRFYVSCGFHEKEGNSAAPAPTDSVYMVCWLK
jgi:ribosomal protein S18 acetylase RimI-like enzyme